MKNKHIGMNTIFRVFTVCLLFLAVAVTDMRPVNAVTLYETDKLLYEEGYIFLGESHVFLMAKAMGEFTDEQGNVMGLNDVRFHYRADASLSVDESGNPNTFTMSGNLFFVYEGWGMGDERSAQISKNYVYSDGAGNRGREVEKIHEIMNLNPNIRHWNIIAYQGAAAVSEKGVGDYYVKSYRNWIQYEFPEADCYFLSMSTMTKCYRGMKTKNDINDALAKAFPERYLDYMDFFQERYPQGMADPTQKSDTLHWNSTTYIELASDIIRNIQQKRANAERQATPVQEAVTDVQALLYTNDSTVIYAEPSLEGGVMLKSCDAGIPMLVTGITANGFYRVCVDADTAVAYIAGTGLSAAP